MATFLILTLSCKQRSNRNLTIVFRKPTNNKQAGVGFLTAVLELSLDVALRRVCK